MMPVRSSAGPSHSRRFVFLAIAAVCLTCSPAPAQNNRTESSKPEASAADSATNAPNEPTKFLARPQLSQYDALEVRSLAFSPDGKLLLTGHGRWTTAGCVRLWDLATKKRLAEFPERRGIRSVAFASDGKRLAYSGWGRVVKVVDIESRDTIKIATPGAARLSFSPDGKMLVTATERPNELKLWDPTTGKQIRSFDGEAFRFQDVCFSPDGSQLAASGGEFTEDRFGRVGIYDVETGRQLRTIDAHDEPVIRVAFSPDGKTLATASGDATARLWDVESGELKMTLVGHMGGVPDVAFTPDGKTLATAGNDGKVVLWDASTGDLLAEMQGHESGALTVEFSPDGEMIASGGVDRVVRLWDVATREQTDVLSPEEAKADPFGLVLAVACSPDGRTIATAHQDSTAVRLRNAETGHVVRLLAGHQGDVSSVAFSPDGRSLATASCDDTVKLWDVATGREQNTLAGHRDWVLSVAFSPDGKTLASSSRDKTVRLWNLDTGECIATIEGHTELIRTVAFSPDGRVLASASADRTVRLWDVESRKEKSSLKTPEGTSAAIAFSPDGKTLADAGQTGAITLWDVGTGEARSSLVGHGRTVWCLAFSPSGRTLASGAFDGRIILWDPDSGERRDVLRGHTEVVTSLTFTPNADALISGSADTTIRRWDGAHPAVATLAGASRHVRSVIFTPDGSRLISAALDGHARVYDTTNGKLLYTLRQFGGAHSAAVTPDSKTLAIGSREIRLWDMRAGKSLAVFGTGNLPIRALAFTQDGSILVSSGDNTVKIWDVASRRLLKSLPRQQLDIAHLAISPDGKTLATTTGDYKQPDVSGQVRLWDLDGGELLQTLPDYLTRYYDVKFTPDGSALVFSDAQNKVCFWDIEEREMKAEIYCDQRARCFEFIPLHNWLVTTGAPGNVSVWDIATGRRLALCEGHEGSTYSLACSPDGTALATGGEEGLVKLWTTPVYRGGDQATAGRIHLWPEGAGSSEAPTVDIAEPPLATLTGPGSAMRYVDFTPDGSKLVVAGYGRRTDVFDMKTGKLVHRLAQESNIFSGAISSDGETLATGGHDIRLWDVKTGERLAAFGRLGGTIRALALSPDGKTLLSGHDNRISIWDVAARKNLTSLTPERLNVYGLAVSPDGKMFAAATGDYRQPTEAGEVKLWDLDSGKLLHSVSGDSTWFYDIAFTPDSGTLIIPDGRGRVRLLDVEKREVKADLRCGSRVRALALIRPGNLFATSAGDGQISIWETASGKRVAMYQGHDKATYTLTSSPDGTVLASGGVGQTVKLWAIPNDQDDENATAAQIRLWATPNE